MTSIAAMTSATTSGRRVRERPAGRGRERSDREEDQADAADHARQVALRVVGIAGRGDARGRGSQEGDATDDAQRDEHRADERGWRHDRLEERLVRGGDDADDQRGDAADEGGDGPAAVPHRDAAGPGISRRPASTP